MRRILPIMFVVIGLSAAGIVGYQRFFKDKGLETVEAAKVAALKAAANQPDEYDRNNAVAAAITALQPDYAASPSKEKFVAALNKQIENEKSIVRLKGDGTTLSRDADFSAAPPPPSGSTGSPPPYSGGPVVPVPVAPTRDDKMIAENSLAVLAADLVHYKRTSGIDFEVEMNAKPLAFTLPADLLPAAVQADLLADALKAVNRAPFSGRTVDKLQKIRIFYSDDNRRFVGAYLYFTGKESDGQSLVQAGYKYAVVSVQFPDLTYPQSACSLLARNILQKLEGLHGKVDRGEVIYMTTIIKIDPVIQSK